MERQAKDGTFYQQVGKDEWTPVTRTAKDGTVYKKVGADDWSPIEIASQKESGPSASRAALVGLQEGATFGAKPFVAGAAGGLGQAVGSLSDGNKSLMDRVSELPEQFQSGFRDARRESQEESEAAARAHPGAYMAGNLVSSILTAPLTAVRGVQAASKAKSVFDGARAAGKIGAGMGAAQALGHANDASDAIEMIGSGAVLGSSLQGAGNTVSKYGKRAASAVGSGAKSLASNLTGIPEKTIETYAKRASSVTKLLSDSGGDISEAADQARGRISQEIQVARQKLNQQIAGALDNPEFGEKVIGAAPLLQAVDDQIKNVGGITAKFRPGEISELKNLRDSIANSLDSAGNISARNLNELKRELQMIASPSYNAGQAIFPRGDLAARGAKGAGAEAKRLLDAAVPDLAKANQQLSRLHVIEQNMNKNLIRAGKPEAALVAAGSGSNPRNAKTLASIDKITGGTALESAENLAAAKTFGRASLNPMDQTGKAVARMATGAGLGYATGGEHGAVMGAALTSPLALKYGMDAARGIGRLTSAVGGRAARDAIRAIPRAEATGVLANQSIRSRAEGIAERGLSRVADTGDQEKPRNSSRPQASRDPSSETAPLRGRAKWAADGVAKLGEHLGREVTVDPDVAQNPKIQKLLIKASGLTPGSKAMDRVMNEIRSQLTKDGE